jgi:2-(1,2-epoxy-1,2-dihydrophenyl)acetyl-CoA isomerase
VTEAIKGNGDYIVERSDGVWTFIINRPASRNALTWDMRYDFMRIVDEAERDHGCHVLIVTGAGEKSFCSGADVSKLSEEMDNFDAFWPVEALQKIHYVGEMARKLITTPLIVISAVNGAAFGGGCFFALAADIVVAHNRAKFGFGFINRGLVTDWAGAFTLPRLVGMARAKNLILRGATVEAEAARDMGMIAEVTEVDALVRAKEIAAGLAGGATAALGMAKQMLAHSFETGVDGMVTYELFAQTLARRTKDHYEGVRSFLEKRPPRFTGR